VRNVSKNNGLTKHFSVGVYHLTIIKGTKIAYNDSSKLPKANEQILAREVRLIDDLGEMLGVVKTEEALRIASGKGLDLVEISPTAEPPVCKLLDFGKYKFELRRKKQESKKKQHVVQLKEVKIRPTTDKHDYDVKVKNTLRFLASGDKVKISLKFRGREVTHNEIGMDVMNRIKEDTLEVARVEIEPKMEGRQIIMILAPK
jgi:translation initiation factor IF-3